MVTSQQTVLRELWGRYWEPYSPHTNGQQLALWEWGLPWLLVKQTTQREAVSESLYLTPVDNSRPCVWVTIVTSQEQTNSTQRTAVLVLRALIIIHWVTMVTGQVSTDRWIDEMRGKRLFWNRDDCLHRSRAISILLGWLYFVLNVHGLWIIWFLRNANKTRDEAK